MKKKSKKSAKIIREKELDLTKEQKQAIVDAREALYRETENWKNQKRKIEKKWFLRGKDLVYIKQCEKEIEDRTNALKEISGILKSGGWLTYSNMSDAVLNLYNLYNNN